MENYKSFVHPFDVNLLEMIFASLQPKVSFSRTWELSVWNVIIDEESAPSS